HPCYFVTFFLMRLRPPRSPLFPYTTLFRSEIGQEVAYHFDCFCSAGIAFGFDVPGFLGGFGQTLEYVFRNVVNLYTTVLDGFRQDRKSTRLNSSHVKISYAVFCLKKKKNTN